MRELQRDDMKKLELLGLQPDGENLTLNDEDGNRYVLPVTDDLRAMLRKDKSPQTLAAEPARQMTPREIQALIREGRTIDEVSDLSALPPSRVSALAGPIEAERDYTARQARAYPVSEESGAFTVEELVTSRLLARGVQPEEIQWDATRKHGFPWVLYARFTSGGIDREAVWNIDQDNRRIEALNDEASWLSETSLTADAGPWRPANTPPVDTGTLYTFPQTASTPATTYGGPGQPPAPEVPGIRAEELTDISGQAASPGGAQSPAYSWETGDVNAANLAAEAERRMRPSSTIDEVLASLDRQRGISRPMPDADNDVAPDEFDGAHRAPEQLYAKDATEGDGHPAEVLPLRPRGQQETASATSTSANSATAAAGTEATANLSDAALNDADLAGAETAAATTSIGIPAVTGQVDATAASAARADAIARHPSTISAPHHGAGKGLRSRAARGSRQKFFSRSGAATGSNAPGANGSENSPAGAPSAASGVSAGSGSSAASGLSAASAASTAAPATAASATTKPGSDEEAAQRRQDAGAQTGQQAAVRTQEQPKKSSRRRDRPEMPSWDEIVFGKKK